MKKLVVKFEFIEKNIDVLYIDKLFQYGDYNNNLKYEVELAYNILHNEKNYNKLYNSLNAKDFKDNLVEILKCDESRVIILDYNTKSAIEKVRKNMTEDFVMNTIIKNSKDHVYKDDIMIATLDMSDKSYIVSNITPDDSCIYDDSWGDIVDDYGDHYSPEKFVEFDVHPSVLSFETIEKLYNIYENIYNEPINFILYYEYDDDFEGYRAYRI